MKPQDIQDLKQLIEFLKQYQVAEFDLDRGDLKIRLKFNQQEGASPALGDLARLLHTAPAAGAAAAPSAPAASAPAAQVAAAAPQEDLHIVKSPIVGTFYASPSPGSAAFISPGDHVDKGQVICIVEAMKLMNEIESDAAGEVVKCLVANGQPVEFGQPLFAVRPA
ncbi:MAG TPA: acetyl-CoA carboxylase biotin carboxyl carrier protein [Terracidiphilus sp.]|jgi:acetyl-CoA carboxylase biotin carboxyl carrier protein|nr:acetyl-CoA carboxylase biotin carboxyl carrier protein [Terracidiphilus sp.]